MREHRTSQRLIEEALLSGVITELNGFTALKREVAYGQENSRIDFRLDYPSGPAYVEVKSVTLGFDGTSVAAFPDAVTQRGAKHLRELAHLARDGIRAVQLYCVNLSGIDAVRPAEEIDSATPPRCAKRWRAGSRYWLMACGSARRMVVDRRLEVLLNG